jgi:hypothetical protein
MLRFIKLSADFTAAVKAVKKVMTEHQLEKEIVFFAILE